MIFTVVTRFFLLLTVLTCIFSGCTNTDQRRGPAQADSGPMVQYSVSGDEELGLVTVKVQFIGGGASALPIGIPGSGTVTLDGKVMEKGSAKLSGIYYEATFAAESEPQPHIIEVALPKNEKFREEFEFSPFTLNSAIPDSMARGDIAFELANVSDGDTVELSMIDTSFYSKGLDTSLRVKDGKITLSKSTLDKLYSGPIQVIFYQEKLRTASGPGGKGIFASSYGLRRRFTLID
jgi:hypothetical protein